MKIFIDAGHNYSGADTGAYYNGIREQDITFDIAYKCKEILSNFDVEVNLSRNKKTDILGTTLNSSLSERARLANNYGADLFISIHCNANSNPSANGTEVYTYNTATKAYPLAKEICNAVCKKLGTYNRGVKTANFAVLRQTNMPAMLIETAFISNASDASKLKNNQDDFASAICNTICTYYGIKQAGKSASEDNKPYTYHMEGTTHIVEVDPLQLSVWQPDLKATDINIANFVNGGYFMNQADGTTFAQGHLVSDGKIISNYATHGKAVTTLCVFYDGVVQVKKIKDVSLERGLKFAISGASLTDYAEEGFTGEFSDIARSTNRTYIGYRKSDNKVVICVRKNTTIQRAKETFDNLNVDYGLTLDGGGSSCMRVDGDWKLKSTRQINNIVMWG